jgi:L-iditol 2-dehydrogenase
VAALVEPLACCLHGVERADVRKGDVVAVLGAGPIGLMLCACVADAGGTPIVVGGRPERRALAAEFGAVVGDAAHADIAIEATGSADGWRDAATLVRRGGTVVLFSGLPSATEVAFDAFRLHYEELTLRGAFHHTPRTVRAALAFLATGARPWQRLLTHEVGLDGLAGLFADPPRDYLKAIVRP